jgi:hypothetical protein
MRPSCQEVWNHGQATDALPARASCRTTSGASTRVDRNLAVHNAESALALARAAPRNDGQLRQHAAPS